MICEVLKFVVDKRGISLPDLSEKSGVPLETIRNLYYGKVKDAKASTVCALSKALDLSMNYLMGDLQYKEDEKELLMAYRLSSDRGKAVIRMFARIESHITAAERLADKYIIPCLIPVGNVHDGIKYNTCDSIEIATDNKDAYLAIEITTNNFAPAYCMGDKILLANRFPENKERAVFLLGGHAYFRTLVYDDKCYILKCLNGRGSDMRIRRMDEIELIGTLVGVIRA